MAIDTIALGYRIRQIRKRRGISQMELADLIDVATTYISYIESGQRCMSLDVFIRISNALHVSADELLKDSLENTLIVENHDFAKLLVDSTDFERKAMFQAAATAKKLIRDNREVFRRGVL